MSKFIKIGSESELPARNEAKEFACEGKTFCVSNVDGHFHAMDNECLHRGGPLGQGTVEDGKVVCPWHGWQYNVTTGKVAQNPTVGVDCYPVEVRGEDIFVDVG